MINWRFFYKYSRVHLVALLTAKCSYFVLVHEPAKSKKISQHGKFLSLQYPPLYMAGESRFEDLKRICYTREQLHQLREVVNISEEILNVKQEVEAKFSGIDPSWGHGESNVPNQAQGHYSETDNRDWRNRHAQFPVSGEEISWEATRERDFDGWFDSRQPEVNQYNGKEHLSSQFANMSQT